MCCVRLPAKVCLIAATLSLSVSSWSEAEGSSQWRSIASSDESQFRYATLLSLNSPGWCTVH